MATWSAQHGSLEIHIFFTLVTKTKKEITDYICKHGHCPTHKLQVLHVVFGGSKDDSQLVSADDVTQQVQQHCLLVVCQA